MSSLSTAEQAQINLSVGGVLSSNYLPYLTMGIVLSASIWSYDWAVANYANPAALAFTHWTLAAEPFLLAADALITSSMFYYLDLRFRIELHKMQQNQAGYRAPRRFRRLIARTVECNLLSLFAQAIAIGLFNNTRIGLYYLITNMMLVKVYTFSLLVSLNCRHPDNGHGTSEGGFSSIRGGDVELNVLGDRHTCAFPSTQIPVHIQRETTIEWQGQTKGPAFNVDEFF
ncbi:hypothetical protein BT96DRAFT_1024024 [Gymnopus androsaceus JB14]|uniref:DUF6534 domain-containing protein n=1 Tax=Gymnopus androsaceus JB14 TaxID=1447944 RepID=A0A6A4H0F6_9AGAR|nr:hypothetical protein BT96DRAFT_1024024 [Gymnopus androsaceus JB14]